MLDYLAIFVTSFNFFKKSPHMQKMQQVNGAWFVVSRESKESI
jgi:hypothetical protein